MLKVKLFAKARDLAGSAEVDLPWTNGQTVAVLKQRLSESYPGLAPLIPQLLVAVNNQYAPDSAGIRSTDEVAGFPPVSGG